jgi:hypothetical protein
VLTVSSQPSRLGPGHLAVTVDGPQALQQALHAVGQRFVGEVLAGEERVAAIGRYVDGVEDGSHRGLRHHRGVRVPLFPHDAQVPGLAANLDDLRIGDDGRVVGVHEDVAEAARERLVLGGVELLVAEEDDAVIEEGAPDGRHARVGEIGAQVDAVDLGPQGAGDGTDLDRHRGLLTQYRFFR